MTDSQATAVAVELTSIQDENLRYGFQIGPLNFIYDTKIACELLRLTPIYPVPNTPAWMLGLINLRGNLVPVFHLDSYFGFEILECKLLLVLGKGEKAVAIFLKDYPKLLRNLTQLPNLPNLIPKLESYILAAYQEEKIWLELDIEAFFTHLGETVCA